MESEVLWALAKTPKKKALKFHLELNLNGFQERKSKKVLG